MTFFPLSGMSGFVVELIVFFGIITSQKYLFMMKILSKLVLVGFFSPYKKKIV
ncbi:NAD(P)H-quinone oxidoreductase chain 4, putative [Medicago truncatula]|uniref:NAD(P)H-quinone oxidoreductase chain 4, putative n=1 Tax=Medicago truncatula TaxID=3880 RepID=G7IAD8_MEDTR|nr:NAD(P)H-quinone oxidoreductase chain 4, putative [Medicago truncatula]